MLHAMPVHARDANARERGGGGARKHRAGACGQATLGSNRPDGALNPKPEPILNLGQATLVETGETVAVKKVLQDKRFKVCSRGRRRER
jgi:hypothetical protein